MLGLLSKILAIVAIVLFVPTTLILASQNAVPGDSTYPVKRKMEDVITAVLSLNPVTKTYFKTDLSKRRFKEAVALLSRGDKNSTASLSELVSQTQSATSSINEISDAGFQKRFTDDLIKQIDDYNKSLSQIEQVKKTQTTAIAKTSTATQNTGQTTTVPQQAITPTAVQTKLIPAESDQSKEIKQTIDALNKIKIELERVKQQQAAASAQNQAPARAITTVPIQAQTVTATPTPTEKLIKLFDSVDSEPAPTVAPVTGTPALTSTPTPTAIVTDTSGVGAAPVPSNNACHAKCGGDFGTCTIGLSCGNEWTNPNEPNLYYCYNATCPQTFDCDPNCGSGD